MAVADTAARTPSSVYAELREGNERFVERGITQRDLHREVRETAEGQHPKAVVLSCLDSRVISEIVFDQGIGDLFVARIAGNFANTDIIGSMEFATKVVGARLIVVLGHTRCGAVNGAADGVELGLLTETLANLQPSVDAVAGRGDIAGPHNSGNAAFVAAVTVENVRRTMDTIVTRSEIIRGLVGSGEVGVVGAVYDVATGRVSWLEDTA